jgi:uncharacterized RDD family membrane protein YckC
MASVPSSGSGAPPPPVWNAQPPEAGIQRYAGFWMRVLAAIIDAIALAILAQIVSFFLPAPPPPPEAPDMDAFAAYMDEIMSPGKLIANTLIAWAYFALQESSSAQASLGKRLLGIRVSAENGARLSLAAASIRAWPMYLANIGWLLAGWLGSLVTLASFVACLSVAFAARKQGLHDKMAGAILTR